MTYRQQIPARRCWRCRWLSYDRDTVCLRCGRQMFAVWVNPPKESSMDDADVMKVRAETAASPKKVNGLDGQGWVTYVRTHPGCTLPPGAATLMVDWWLSITNPNGSVK